MVGFIKSVIRPTLLPTRNTLPSGNFNAAKHVWPMPKHCRLPFFWNGKQMKWRCPAPLAYPLVGPSFRCPGIPPQSSAAATAALLAGSSLLRTTAPACIQHCAYRHAYVKNEEHFSSSIVLTTKMSYLSNARDAVTSGTSYAL